MSFLTTTTLFTVLLLVACAHASSSMQFHSSSFIVNSGDSSVPHGIAVPVAIQLIDVNGNIDTSDSITVITASSTTSALSGNVAQAVNGVARFMMTFTSCNGGVVTFTAHSDNASVNGKTLSTGTVRIAALPNAEVLFDSASVLQSGRINSIAADGKPIDAFKINLYDSCGAIDKSLTGLTVVATTTAGSLRGETTATFTDGVAIFSGVSLVDASSAQLSFTVASTSVTPVAAAGKKLTVEVSTAVVSPNSDVLFCVTSNTVFVGTFLAACVVLAAIVAVAAMRRRSASANKYMPVVTVISSTDSCSV